ncbi:hypothetical protein G5714_006928 [Onychostoma macrolepis]|uniref:Uncharacterized protein n=1 Tax=Onychostoma macrolepis TaxID=369639 RepID=A0A7J6CYP7_9TELE|nr:hypothetical protein G5714_006928 [Onychostoma macrolepis]
MDVSPHPPATANLVLSAAHPYRAVTEFNQQTWVQQGSSSISGRETGASRITQRTYATEKTCLMVIFWGVLADPFKSMMPYWAPEESLEDYINLALHLSGSAFRVELAAEPTQSSPEATIQGASQASSAAPSTSRPFPERPRLIRNTLERRSRVTVQEIYSISGVHANVKQSSYSRSSPQKGTQKSFGMPVVPA